MKIGVFFGGKNPEHDISILTGQLVLNGLKKAGFDACAVYLGKNGDWHIGKELEDVSFFKKKADMKGMGRWSIDLERSRGKMTFVQKGIFGTAVEIDMAFPAFHGQNGEDGTAQGLFELFGIPYVGCGVACSAIAMDKVTTKLLYEQAGFPTTKFIWFRKADWDRNKDDFMNKIRTGLKWPLFVKPARLGSSIGIAKAGNEKELLFAVDVAFRYDDKILVEEGVESVMDVTCCVIGAAEPVPSLLQECIFAEGFFSYEDKYLTGGGAQLGNAKSGFEIPARLDEATTASVRNLAVKVFSKFECSGIARVDFLYDAKAGAIFVNEINTMPGTVYHHLWEKSGIPLPELMRRLVACAHERHKEKEGMISSFSSNVLAHADWSAKLGKR